MMLDCAIKVILNELMSDFEKFAIRHSLLVLEPFFAFFPGRP
jgi:hypothetical protein